VPATVSTTTTATTDVDTTNILAAAGELPGDAALAKRLADAPTAQDAASAVDEPPSKRSRVDEPASVAARVASSLDAPINVVPLNLREPGARVALLCSEIGGVGNGGWLIDAEPLAAHLTALNQGIAAILCETVALPADEDVNKRVSLQPTTTFNNVQLPPRVFTWNGVTMLSVPSTLSATVGSYVIAPFRRKYQRVATDTMYTGVITSVHKARAATSASIYFPFDKARCQLKNTEFAVVVSGANRVVALPSADDGDEDDD
jgi:hypothetical protein